MDTLREWIGTLGTLAVFFWAVILYWLSLRDKAMEQARLVSVVPLEPQVVGVGKTFQLSVGEANVGSDADFEYVRDPDAPDTYTGVYRATSQLQIRRIEIHNRSAEVVYELTATVGDRHRTHLVSTVAHTVYLRPGEMHSFAFLRNRDIKDWFTKEKELRVWVYFTDNVGQRWRKTLAGPIERIPEAADHLDTLIPRTPDHWFGRLPFASWFRHRGRPR